MPRKPAKKRQIIKPSTRGTHLGKPIIAGKPISRSPKARTPRRGRS